MSTADHTAAAMQCSPPTAPLISSLLINSRCHGRTNRSGENQRDRAASDLAHDELDRDPTIDGTAGTPSRWHKSTTSVVSKRDGAEFPLNFQNAGGTNRARIGRSDSYETCSRQISALAEADYQMKTNGSCRASNPGYKRLRRKNRVRQADGGSRQT